MPPFPAMNNEVDLNFTERLLSATPKSKSASHNPPAGVVKKQNQKKNHRRWKSIKCLPAM